MHTCQGRRHQRGETARMGVKARGTCRDNCHHCCAAHFPCCLIALPPSRRCPCVVPPLPPAGTSYVSCPLCPHILSTADASYMSCPSAHMFFPPHRRVLHFRIFEEVLEAILH